MTFKEQNLRDVVTDISGQDLEHAVRSAKLGVIMVRKAPIHNVTCPSLSLLEFNKGVSSSAL